MTITFVYSSTDTETIYRWQKATNSVQIPSYKTVHDGKIILIILIFTSMTEFNYKIFME